jgi:hypothetical protein
MSGTEPSARRPTPLPVSAQLSIPLSVGLGSSTRPKLDRGLSLGNYVVEIARAERMPNIWLLSQISPRLDRLSSTAPLSTARNDGSFRCYYSKA